MSYKAILEYVVPTISIGVFISGVLYIILKDSLAKVFVNKSTCVDHVAMIDLKLTNLTELFHSFKEETKADLGIIKKYMAKKGE